MYTPDRTKIFEEIEFSTQCLDISCSNAVKTGRKDDYGCIANAHGECLRVNSIASEINQFIADNEDMLNLIQCIGE